MKPGFPSHWSIPMIPSSLLVILLEHLVFWLFVFLLRIAHNIQLFWIKSTLIVSAQGKLAIKVAGLVNNVQYLLDTTKKAFSHKFAVSAEKKMCVYSSYIYIICFFRDKCLRFLIKLLICRLLQALLLFIITGELMFLALFIFIFSWQWNKVIHASYFFEFILTDLAAVFMSNLAECTVICCQHGVSQLKGQLWHSSTSCLALTQQSNYSCHTEWLASVGAIFNFHQIWTNSSVYVWQ